MYPHPGAVRPLSHAIRVKLKARLARPILARARTMPTVRTTRPSRHFWAAKTCSTRERTRARVALPRAAARDVGWHLPTPWLLAPELRRQAAPLLEGQVRRRAIGGVGPYIACRVVAVEHRAELAAIIGRRVGDGVAPHKAELTIDADMIFVPEHRHRDLDLALLAVPWDRLALGAALDRPTPVVVDLSPPRRCPFGRHPPPLIVSFSAWVSRGRRAWITVASTIWPPIASQPLARSSPSKRANSRSAAPARANCSRYSQIVLASGTGSCSASPITA